ncbi:hypothetical protein RhiirA4_453929 [Rhizophagus irregularis]|uniref:Uncharacterized protein n=1 Tax=Rhizophagus irregularis TaxID=588596 RepID=A0A2I1G1N6_9GLOM|nr:hypothetical protein RhiirA4_453929 [Rhizophagus irregularis]
MQSEINLLKEINSKSLAEITELRKKNAEVKAENIEVKAENAKLKYILEEHEARFTNYSDHSIEKNNADPIFQDFDSIPLDQTNIPSVVDQYNTTEFKSLEDDRETDSFLDEMHRKKISNEIREKKWKIKL